MLAIVPPPMGFNMQEIPKFVKEAEIKLYLF